MQKKRQALMWTLFGIPALIIMATVTYLALDQWEDGASRAASDHLLSLKRGNYPRAYYLYTTDNYQEENSLDQFQEWVDSHPILSDYESVDFFGQNIRGTTATLTGELKSKDQKLTPIIYRMSKEYGDWKIDNVQLMPIDKSLALKKQTDNLRKDRDQEDIAKAVQDHLLSLKHRDIQKAYDAYMSEEFKKTVPFAEYETIVYENPELREYDSIRFGKIQDNEGFKQLSLTLISDEDLQDLKFWLSHERGKWKIWAIEVGRQALQDEEEIAEEPNAKKPARETENQDQEEAVKTIKSQLEDIKKENLSKAYEDYASPKFMEVTSEKDFKKFINNYPEFTKYHSMKVKDVSEHDGITHVQLVLTTDKGNSDIDYWLSKEDKKWKIWGIRVEKSAYYPPIPEKEKLNLVQVIKDQLQAVKEGDISKAYYAFSSQDFQNNTSLDDFKTFLKDYPIFQNEEEVMVGQGIKEGDLRLLKIGLKSKDETIEIDYRLIKQDGEWKIWGIQLLSNVQGSPEKEKEIKGIIENQITALKADDLSKAYYAYTSNQFQKSASFDAFKEYVSKHGEMADNKGLKVIDINFKPTFASAAVLLKGPSETEKTYLYRFIQENNQWKILSIRMMPNYSELRKNHKPLEITKVTLGTDIDLHGLVINPATVFTPQDRDLTANVYVENGEPGDQVEAVLEHVKTKSSIPPVVAELVKPGHSVVNYVFTAPTQGWPTGLYRLRITSPSGASKTVEFNIIKNAKNNSGNLKEQENQLPEGTKHPADTVKGS